MPALDTNSCQHQLRFNRRKYSRTNFKKNYVFEIRSMDQLEYSNISVLYISSGEIIRMSKIDDK